MGPRGEPMILAAAAGPLGYVLCSLQGRRPIDPVIFPSPGAARDAVRDDTLADLMAAGLALRLVPAGYEEACRWLDETRRAPGFRASAYGIRGKQEAFLRLDLKPRLWESCPAFGLSCRMN